MQFSIFHPFSGSGRAGDYPWHWWDTPKTITGLPHRDGQPFTITFTPTYLCTVEISLRTQKDTRKTCQLCAKGSQAWSVLGWNPSPRQVRTPKPTSNHWTSVPPKFGIYKNFGIFYLIKKWLICLYCKPHTKVIEKNNNNNCFGMEAQVLYWHPYKTLWNSLKQPFYITACKIAK